MGAVGGASFDLLFPTMGVLSELRNELEVEPLLPLELIGFFQ